MKKYTFLHKMHDIGLLCTGKNRHFVGYESNERLDARAEVIPCKRDAKWNRFAKLRGIILI